MDCEEIEPVVHSFRWSSKLDFTLSKCIEESLVADITESVQRKQRRPLLEEERVHGNVVVCRYASDIVDQP